MRNLLISFLLIINLSCFSQDTTNLVPNWSFEIKDSCPSSQLFENFVAYWYNANQSTPNYFDTCATNPIADVPNNGSGFQYAKSGSSYAGIVINGGLESREYISVKLNEKLKLNDLYCFELYYSLANISCYSSPDIQALFSADSVYQNDVYVIDREPQIINNNPNIYDTLNWQLMKGEFISDGTEQYLTIGNFYFDSESSVFLFDTNSSSCTYGGVYFYLDDIRLYDCTEFDTNVYEISVFPNPNNGSFIVNYNLGENISTGSFKVYDAIGKLVYDEKLFQNNGILNLNLNLSSGIYFWEIRDDEKKLLRSDKMVVVY